MVWLTLSKIEPKNIPLYSYIAIISLYMKLKIKIFPFKSIVKGHDKKELTQIEISEKTYQLINKLSKIMRQVCRNLPWQSNCYNQALVASKILRWYQIPYTICFGIKKENQTMTAHAWVIANHYNFCGTKGLEGFTIIAKYTRNNQ